MPEVFPKHVLLRVGGRTWATYGQLAMAGSGRHLTPVPITFSRADASTCASFLGQDGKLYTAAANIPRIDYTPYYADGLTFTLPDGSTVPARGLVLEGSRTNLVLQSQDFGTTWAAAATPTRTPAAVTHGLLVLDLIADNDTGAPEGYTQNVTFTGDAAKAVSIFMKAGATPPASGNVLILRDTTAAADRLRMNVTWSGGVPTVTPTNGTHIKTQLIGSGIYRLHFQTAAVTAANTNQLQVFAANTAETGDGYFGGVQAENALFPSSYIKTTTGTVTRAADSFTLPFNWGPVDMTVLTRLHRPVHADVSGTLGTFPALYRLATSVPLVQGFFGSTARNISANVDTATTDASASQSVPAGAALTVLHQYRNIATGGQANSDVGSGLAGFSSAATGFAAYANQTCEVGTKSGQELHGVLLDLMILRGLFTRAEAMAVA